MGRARGRKARNEREAGATSPDRGAQRSAPKTASRGPSNADGGEKTGLQHNERLFEAEVLDGLAPICSEELVRLLGRQVRVFPSSNPSSVSFEYSGDPAKLLGLRTAVAVFRLLYFKVPHPLTIVQGANLPRLKAAIAAARARERFKTFRISAAGSESKVFQKIKNAIASASGLANDEQEGQMSIRFRRARLRPFGWDVLVRLTPLPLSARAWRVENMPGALNATIAAAMVLQMDPRPTDQFLNLMCGSGTLIAERAAICPAKRLVGVDNSREAIAKARKNLARVASVMLLEQDAGKLSLQDGSMNALCADLPWGRLIGDRNKLQGCYEEALREMSRVCSAGGMLSVITQESALFEKALERHREYWTLDRSLRVKQADYKPKLYVLKRRSKAYSAEA